MTPAPAEASSQPRRPGRSAAALFAGFFAVVFLSLGTDQLLHTLGVYPPWGEPMNETSDNLLALSYRCVYSAVGSYIAAGLAPRNPMRHALILGAVGFVLSVAGAVGASQADLGPLWYPIALVVTTLPCAWLGGIVHRALHRQR
jgi:hypothetical protein